MRETTEPESAPGGERDEAAVSRFVERFAADLTEAGMQRMAARVFAALLVSDSGALSSAELAERLRISPAAVSGAIRYLSQVDMVVREREPGSRRDRYRLFNEVWYETLTRRDQVLSRWESTMRDGAKVLGPGTPAGQRITETADFFEWVQQELPRMLERWRHQQAERRAAESRTAEAG
ncbi:MULTISPECIES: GbsR/MarR family transcriptional regulator [Streptomyces]|uniref:DNA-binding transcriptional regulator GbsR (MarR family) n=2 Tax=Streptomyces TaxID=1883 RepID=A0ABT9KJD5_9ACTN|nr:MULTISPECIES: MarR family transcriptional regulator [Streptomyces]MBW8087931.1 MarR family transcriptional regulator [Streptomyces hygroscopicus subsp. hygroscopicus]MCO8308094.1 MarR family transcriptional regulator [Streptomyces sp. RKCA744]MDN3055791.1 MarR family transcriptional regulator [Streptomyces sp. SRF1]MDP9608515.1 DNA-binding transcriptional regulator GbsR (MarR family) [Streptomyces demainii]GHJ30200.1 MarR family transcriptional regulator [Streptomyces hygroscopicus]